MQVKDVIILDKMWTYCANFSHSARAGVEIKGPIFATGLYEGYVRIPWLGDQAPRTHCPVKCHDDRRPPAERTATGRYLHPSFFEH
jgi:hypothetical protein